MYVYIYIDIDIDIYMKTTQSKLEIKNENWETVKRLRSHGIYVYLIYDHIITKGKFCKQENELI